MLLSGTAIAHQIHEELAAKLHAYLPRRPRLVAVLVGDNPASHLYVSSKIRACEKVGFTSDKILLPAATSQQELLQRIEELNNNPEVTGILVQLPLPEQIDPLCVANHINPAKDVDGISPVNYGKLLMGDPSGFVSCTPLGIQCLLQRYHIATEGKHIVIAGRSNIVGKPLACLLMQKAQGANATVTVVHSQTPDIAHHSRQADILVAAIGQAHYFTADMIKEGAVVIDVGQNRPATPGGRLVGDVDFDSVQPKCAAITPVPGGVGPMTIAMLLSNTLKAFEQGARSV
jgi:methylenetetrahydrofolate dehydrogenase (NADP+)/methenyltetrahydrofolate cyclohydrolase